LKIRNRQSVEVGFIPAATQPSNTKHLQASRLTGGGPAGEDLRPHPRSQRSQALIEFALVSPVLLLLLFGIVDIGRAVFYYDTLNHAAREGARTAVRASSQLPTNNDILNSVTTQLIGAPVTFGPSGSPCPQGPVTSAIAPANSAYLYITEPSPPTTVETSPPANAPGGEYPAVAAGSCSAVNPAGGNQQLQVTLKFNLILITPVIAQATANRIEITAAAIFRTEY
jgi:Flp pilus assembly protein TadG